MSVVKAPAMKLFTTVKAIDTATVDIFNRGQALQADLHVLACSVLAHFGKHNDKRVVLGFIQAIPEFGRVNAMKAWFEEFGPLKFDTDGIVYLKTKGTKLGDAMAMPFWKFKPEAPYQAMDVAKAVEQFIKRLQKDTIETNVDHTSVINALQGLPLYPHTPMIAKDAIVAAMN